MKKEKHRTCVSGGHLEWVENQLEQFQDRKVELKLQRRQHFLCVRSDYFLCFEHMSGILTEF